MSKLETNTIDTVSGTANLTIGGANNTGSTTIKTNDTTAITVDSSQNVGIGTSSPGSLLHIDGTNPKITVGTSGSNVTFLQRVSDDFYIFNRESAGHLLFGTADTERMRIDSSGNVLFGISASIDSGDNGISLTTAGIAGLARYGRSGTGSNSHIQFYNANGNVGTITTNGSSTTYGTSSDHRLKENVSYDFDATTRLKQLKPARFNFIADADTTVDGFIAHEVSSIVPEAITGTHNATETKEKVVVNANGNVIAENIEQADWETGKIADENGNTQYPTDSTWEATKVVPVYQGIDQSKLVPLLVKTIQELEARITTLENA